MVTDGGIRCEVDSRRPVESQVISSTRLIRANIPSYPTTYTATYKPKVNFLETFNQKGFRLETLASMSMQRLGAESENK